MWKSLGRKVVRAAVDVGVRELQRRANKGRSGKGGSDTGAGGSNGRGSNHHQSHSQHTGNGHSSNPADARPRKHKSSGRQRSHEAQGAHDYAGDFHAEASFVYDPVRNDRPDPGEVVWAWVPYEEDHSKGKDRPVLLIARHGHDFLALMLTSKDHDHDAEQEARHGRYWMDIGSGAWDRKRRPSEVRLDRVLQIDEDDVRREGTALKESTFKEVERQVRRVKGW